MILLQAWEREKEHMQGVHLCNVAAGMAERAQPRQSYAWSLWYLKQYVGIRRLLHRRICSALQRRHVIPTAWTPPSPGIVSMHWRPMRDLKRLFYRAAECLVIGVVCIPIYPPEILSSSFGKWMNGAPPQAGPESWENSTSKIKCPSLLRMYLSWALGLHTSCKYYILQWYYSICTCVARS